MNFDQINNILINNHLSIQDVMKIAKKFENKDLNDEKELRVVINDLSILVGKQIPTQQIDKMIQMVKNNQINQ